jgi:kynurenine 3-monooxygenase
MGTHKHKVLIAGAGLVGSLAGIFLARRGDDVSIFERRNDPRNGKAARGRAINLALSNRGLKALARLGLTRKLSEMMIPMHGRMMHDQYGALTFQPYGRENEAIHSISRRELNLLLINEAEQAGVQLHFNHKIEEIDLTSTTVGMISPHRAAVVPSDLLIGADGAFSAVRKALQVTDRFNFTSNATLNTATKNSRYRR